MKITPGTMDETNQEISRLIARRHPGLVLSANVYSINLVSQLPWLRELYERADIIYVDGAGVVLGAKLLGVRIPPRITMADWGWVAASHCAAQGHSLFLLGNPPGVAAQAAEKLEAHAPGLKIVGTHHGFFDKYGPANGAMIEEINRAAPDILMVGLGMPLEQRWILDNCARIQAGIFWEVGAAFSYWAGLAPRCPRWMADHSLEWLFRFLCEPRRMAKRYLWGNLVFMYRILKERRRLAKRSKSWAPT
jgi:N-acetylglucosaminyldiphosphoundecaprenol N-acetyl-beta-D-mannosaminyltransferase